MMEGGRQSRGTASTTYSSAGRTFAKKVLGLVSKRKRDEEKKRLDLWRAMRDSSVERLAAVISSARTEFGDRLSDLCADAERVLHRLVTENNSQMASSQVQPSGTRRKVTLRERLLLADCESNTNSCTEDPTAGIFEPASAPSGPPMIQAVLTLVRPPQQAQESSSLNNTIPPGTLSGHLEEGNSHESNGRRLLSALLWEERNMSSEPAELGWLAFGVSVEPSSTGTTTTGIHVDHSRSQSLELGTLDSGTNHRPTASLDGTQQEPQTPMRVSLMSLLSEAEEAGVIFMNGKLLQSSSSPPRTSRDQAGLEQMCCVCMGYQKGAAFIPCGHTFCRKCCRELRAARGTCPLCNKEIDDILNLY